MRRNHDLAVSARRLLCERLGMDAPCPEDMLGSMATLPLPEGFPHREPERFDPDQTWLLEEHRFEVPFMRWDERRWFRVCAHAYNELADYERLAEALRQRL
jgi:isopenicillin-N epimerase